DSLIVEHWDNLQETATEPNPSGHTMIDGPTSASDLDKTDANKALMQRYMDDLLAGRRETFPSYFNGTEYIQHNPWVADTIPGLITGLQALAAKGQAVIYKRVHMVLGEGNFVLVVAEATFGGVFLTCAWSQGKLSGCVDPYANAERLSWTHSTHSTRKGFFDIRAPAPSRQY